MGLRLFKQYLPLHPKTYLVLSDIDGPLKEMVVHWTRLIKRVWGILLDTRDIVCIDDLFDLVPRDSEIRAWLHASFLHEENYVGMPLVSGVPAAMSYMRHHGGDVIGCLTSRREHLRKVTEPGVHLQLGAALHVVMRPDDMHWSATKARKVAFLLSVWPRIKGIIEDDPKIVPALREANYKGTVYLYRSQNPYIPGIRVVSCATPMEIALAIAEDAKRFRSLAV